MLKHFLLIASILPADASRDAIGYREKYEREKPSISPLVLGAARDVLYKQTLHPPVDVPHVQVTRKEICPPGKYCPFNKDCSNHRDQCINCGQDPDRQQNGLQCLSCKLSWLHVPECHACPVGDPVVLKETPGLLSRQRKYCRPPAVPVNGVPQLCAAATQGGLQVASTGNRWKMQTGGRTQDVIARLQDVTHENGKILVYLAIFELKGGTNVVAESAASWAGAMMYASHTFGFYLGKNTELSDIFQYRELGMRTTVEFVEGVKKNLVDVDSNPIVNFPVFKEMTIEALWAVKKCFRLFEEQLPQVSS
eukprot:TRINITY_DN19241_c0_g2_i1.p1 TRINITY_DN19241_c0_g2~~TRINITY_DN19241_c0_g2_i1.p1  ORF type:complete len:308 (-),score=42.65 TRINITY_DN19241_c0_g2_i1:183-1106(-)